jgi:hypothetical protein
VIVTVHTLPAGHGHKLVIEISRRIVDAGDDVPQVAKDVGCDIRLAAAVRDAPEFVEE